MSSAAGDREQKMLDSTTQNLSERLTEVRKTLGTLITKVRKKDVINSCMWRLILFTLMLQSCHFHNYSFISDGNRSKVKLAFIFGQSCIDIRTIKFFAQKCKNARKVINERRR